MYSLRVGVTLSRDLLRAARRGDKSACNQLGKWLTDELIAYYTRQGSPDEDISDFSQESSLRIIRALADAPEEPESFRAWTIGVARMVALENSTRDKRQRRKQLAIVAQPRTSMRRPDSVLSFRALLDWVRSELRKLPSPYRQTFELMLEREGRKDVAEEQDLPEGTVGRRVWWVRRRLDSARRRRGS